MFRVGTQLADTLRRLRNMRRKEAKNEALALLRSVRISDPQRVYRSFPHELSGGMCQRVCIAIALAGEPELIIADEPTTGLDVTIQAEILRLLGDLISEHNAAGMLITHDLGVVADVCDRVAVMYAGRVVNLGTTAEIYRQALHPYANQLVSIATSLDSGGTPQEIPGRVPNPGEDLAPCAFAPRCFRAEADCFETEPPLFGMEGQLAFCHHPVVGETVFSMTGTVDTLQVQDLTKIFKIKTGSFQHADLKAVDKVNISIPAGRTLAVVGESGSGKTTLARLILRLLEPTQGTVLLEDTDITGMEGTALEDMRARMQIVFQDPYDSLSPWQTVGRTVAEPLLLHQNLSRQQAIEPVANMLERVGLSPEHAQRYPHELSGGQAQRVGIARAMITNPALVVLDEPTSSLDMSVQSQILLLLQSLQEELNISYMFISHDLTVVRYIANDLAVMYLGKVVESGPARPDLCVTPPSLHRGFAQGIPPS